MTAETVGALVVVFKDGRKSTYRWIKECDYTHIAMRDLRRADEYAKSAARIHKSSLQARLTMSPEEFKEAFGGNTPAQVDALLHQIFLSTLSLWRIEELVPGIHYLSHARHLRIDFSTVKSIEYTEIRAV